MFARERGQSLIVMLAALLFVLLGASALGAFGKALLGRGRYQRAADLIAVSAARSMHDDFGRLFEPALLPNGTPNPHHMSKTRYLLRARAAASAAARGNGVDLRLADVRFPDIVSFAPNRVRVRLKGKLLVRGTPAQRSARKVPVAATAEAALTGAGGGGGFPAIAEGGGYSGRLAYRQGKPMRPDVALAFDRMAAAARRDGVSLLVNSGFRSDAEQAKLFAEHSDPRWVARPGESLHRNATELDLGPPSAYRWLASNAGRFRFTKRYSWEPWHYGYTLNARSTPNSLRGSGKPGDDRSALPAFVPERFAPAISRAASRWNVSSALLAAQLYAESNFNPFATSGAGAQGIAQFMPGTARTYGLKNPFNAAEAIDAQGHLMRDLLRQFGSVSLALAAYNAGPGAVSGCGCVPAYRETRAYVAKVLGLMGGAGDIGGLAGAGLEVRLVR